MPTLINWQLTSTTGTEYFPGTATAITDLKTLANNGGSVGAAVENTNGHQYVRLHFRARLGSAGTAGGYCNLWMLRGMDIGAGVVYEDGTGHATAPTVPARPPDHVFPLDTTITTQQVIASPLMLAPPEDFKFMLVNKTGYAFTGTDNENELWYQFVDDESQ